MGTTKMEMGAVQTAKSSQGFCAEWLYARGSVETGKFASSLGSNVTMATMQMEMVAAASANWKVDSPALWTPLGSQPAS